MFVCKLFLRLKRSFFIMQLPLLRELFRIGNNPEFDIKKDVFSIPEVCCDRPDPAHFNQNLIFENSWQRQMSEMTSFLNDRFFTHFSIH